MQALVIAYQSGLASSPELAETLSRRTVSRPPKPIELVYRHSWRTRDEAENAIFAYIDGWYTRRIQKDLGWQSPAEYEAAWHTRQARHNQTAKVQPEPTGAR